MLIWDRELRHKFLSPDHRKYYIIDMSLTKAYKLLNVVSVILNIAIPLAIYYFYGLDLIIFGIAFISLDIILNLFEQIFFISIPWLFSKIKSKKYIQYRIKKITKQKRKIESDIYRFRKMHCDKCDDTWNTDECERCSSLKALIRCVNELDKKIGIEEKFLQDILEKRSQNKNNQVVVKETAVQIKKVENTPTVVNTDYFQNISNILNDIINKERFDFLIPLKKSSASMSQILKNKPNGKKIIPISLYSNIDDLIILINKIIEMKKDDRGQYIEKISNITKNISDNMQTLMLEINKLVKEDDENEIEILLQKFIKEENINA